LKLAGASVAVGEKRPRRRPRALDVEQNMSGEFAAVCTENSSSRLPVQRPDADDEERPEPDGQQDDARLIAGPREMQHGVAQRKRT
jgi:hypothetical protein